MQTETKMVRRRKALTPVEHFKSIHCSPSDFQKKQVIVMQFRFLQKMINA